MANDLYEDIDPETGWSRAAIWLMAEAISKARPNPKSWALFSIDGIPRLNIGKRNVVEMYPDRVDLWANVSPMQRLKLGGHGVRLMRDPEPARHFPDGGTISFPIGEAREIVPALSEPFLKAMAHLSDRLETLPKFHQMHDECLRLKLNEVGGVDIKSPAYTGYKTLRELNCE